jgi:uncharacterized protein YjiS (DUF1127 family)
MFKINNILKFMKMWHKFRKFILDLHNWGSKQRTRVELLFANLHRS